jgi:filamentous hemagglutinin family protein
MRRTFLLHHGMPTLCLYLTTYIFGPLLLWISCLSASSQAQVAPITSSGLNTIVTTNGTVHDITGGTRPGGGGNLFHSFGDFNVPNNNIANFLNTPINGVLPATSNILGRVTGGNISNIFGTIQTTGFGNANLFLMNPAGFLFGPNATVNVGGMVAFTSADYLRLQGAGGDGIFYADPAANSVLTTSPVAAFGFLGSNPGAITVQGSQFTVAEGSGISLVGGNITIQSGTLDNGTVQAAQLSAQGGQINLVSVASPGEILAGTLAQTPNVNGQSFGNLGTIQVSEQSVIDVSGNGGGTVLIRGGQFVLDNSAIFANVTGPGPVINGVESIGAGIDIAVTQDAVIQNGALLDTSIFGNATPGVQYGGVSVKANHVEVMDSGIFSDSISNTGGNSGDIRLEANSILVNDTGTFTTMLETSTQGAGNAGNIILRANGNLVTNALLESDALSGSGNGGNITLTSTNGDINLDAPFIATQSFTTGNAGNIAVTSTHGNITINDFPFITSQTFSSGHVGNITVSAPVGDILLTDAILGTRISETGATAGYGGFQFTANNMTMVNSLIGIDNFGAARSGNLVVNLTGTLSVSGPEAQSIIQTTTRGAAQSADLNLTAHDILLTDNSIVATSTFGSGDAGTLNIVAQNLTLANGAQLTSSSIFKPSPAPGAPIVTPSGAAGTVNVHSPAGPARSVLIDGAGSAILTTTEGTGAGGNITLNANSVTLQNGGLLSATTSGTAPSAIGGTIIVNANQLQINSAGLITASTTGAGAGGSINLNTGSTFASNAGTVSSTATQATGGDIAITAGQSVTLTNGASVTASSTGAGNAGSIMINAGGQFAMTNSTVTTEANQSSGGAIKITTNPNGTVQLTDSKISASVLDGTGGGGSVNIDPQYVVLQNSQILANAVFGPGGNISITTNLLLQDAASVISASSRFGQQGTITIQSPINPAGGKIIPLSQKPLIATALLSQRCAALAGGEYSSFTVAGRDSLPAEPGSWLSSPLAALSAGPGQEASGEGETPLLSLRQIAPPGFLTRAFAVESSAGCTL